MEKSETQNLEEIRKIIENWANKRWRWNNYKIENFKRRKLVLW